MRIPSEAELMDGRPGRQYVGGTRHWHDPVVHTWENFVTAAECGKLVALGAPQTGGSRFFCDPPEHLLTSFHTVLW
jgi:hypothetical protein